MSGDDISYDIRFTNIKEAIGIIRVNVKNSKVDGKNEERNNVKRHYFLRREIS